MLDGPEDVLLRVAFDHKVLGILHMVLELLRIVLRRDLSVSGLRTSRSTVLPVARAGRPVRVVSPLDIPFVDTGWHVLLGGWLQPRIVNP